MKHCPNCKEVIYSEDIYKHQSHLTGYRCEKAKTCIHCGKYIRKFKEHRHRKGGKFVCKENHLSKFTCKDCSENFVNCTCDERSRQRIKCDKCETFVSDCEHYNPEKNKLIQWLKN